MGALSQRLGVVADERVMVRPEIVPVDAFDADPVEITIPQGSRMDSVALRDSPPPRGARVSVIYRSGETLVARGDTTLAAEDVLLVVAPRNCDLDRLEEWTQAVASSE